MKIGKTAEKILEDMEKEIERLELLKCDNKINGAERIKAEVELEKLRNEYENMSKSHKIGKYVFSLDRRYINDIWQNLRVLRSVIETLQEYRTKEDIEDSVVELCISKLNNLVNKDIDINLTERHFINEIWFRLKSVINYLENTMTVGAIKAEELDIQVNELNNALTLGYNAIASEFNVPEDKASRFKTVLHKALLYYIEQDYITDKIMFMLVNKSELYK